MQETVDEFIQEVDVILTRLHSLKNTLVELEQYYSNLSRDMKTFGELTDEWTDYFDLAKKEFENCRMFKANTLQEMSNNLDQIQVIFVLVLSSGVDVSDLYRRRMYYEGPMINRVAKGTTDCFSYMGQFSGSFLSYLFHILSTSKISL